MILSGRKKIALILLLLQLKPIQSYSFKNFTKKLPRITKRNLLLTAGSLLAMVGIGIAYHIRKKRKQVSLHLWNTIIEDNRDALRQLIQEGASIETHHIKRAIWDGNREVINLLLDSAPQTALQPSLLHEAARGGKRGSRIRWEPFDRLSVHRGNASQNPLPGTEAHLQETD